MGKAALAALRRNSRGARLVTPWDLHATLRHLVLGWGEGETHDHFGVRHLPGAREVQTHVHTRSDPGVLPEWADDRTAARPSLNGVWRPQSLLVPLSANRTCQQAGLDADHCRPEGSAELAVYRCESDAQPLRRPDLRPEEYKLVTSMQRRPPTTNTSAVAWCAAALRPLHRALWEMNAYYTSFTKGVCATLTLASVDTVTVTQTPIRWDVVLGFTVEQGWPLRARYELSLLAWRTRVASSRSWQAISMTPVTRYWMYEQCAQPVGSDPKFCVC